MALLNYLQSVANLLQERQSNLKEISQSLLIGTVLLFHGPDGLQNSKLFDVCLLQAFSCSKSTH